MKKYSGISSAPKPLAGQAGYKMTESAMLEKEAKEMEMRLSSLQMRMKSEESASTTTTSGSKWGSSQAGKGSVTNYAKDIQEKHKKRSEMYASGQLNASQTRRQEKEPIAVVAEPSFRDKAVEQWTNRDVGSWLNSVQLGKYATAFAENEISGSLLLDITLDDLDYMEIKVLGHRKIILKGAEELRKNRRISADNPPAPPSNTADYNEQKEKKAAAPVQQSHWSDLEPLSANPAKNPAANYGINAADDEDDVMDEEKERLAFMAAVNEWRNAPTSAERKATDEREEASGGTSLTAQSGTWNNPFGAAPEVEKVAPLNQTFSLMNGELDEQKEQEEFKKAVDAWRTAGLSSNQDQSDFTGRPVSLQSSSTETSMHTVSPTVNNMTSVLAEKLAKELDTEQAESVQKLQAQKAEASQRLTLASMELEKMRTNIKSRSGLAESSQKESDEKKFCQFNDSDDDFDDDKNSPIVYDSTDQEMFTKYTYSSKPNATPTKYDSKEDLSEDDAEVRHNVKILQIETMASPAKFAESDDYLVDEGSDTD